MFVCLRLFVRDVCVGCLILCWYVCVVICLCLCDVFDVIFMRGLCVFFVVLSVFV